MLQNNAWFKAVAKALLLSSLLTVFQTFVHEYKATSTIVYQNPLRGVVRTLHYNTMQTT